MITLVTNKDLTAASGKALSFSWDKDHFISGERSGVFNGEATTLQYNFKLLNIKFNNLIMEDGTTYTLLIDRRRYAERKKTEDDSVNPPIPAVYRKAKYYHEKPSDAEKNNRLSEMPITTTDGQYFNFHPEYYINLKGIPTGIKNNNTVYLSFRVRTEKNGVIKETESLGTIGLKVFTVGGKFKDQSSSTISYCKPN